MAKREGLKRDDDTLPKRYFDEVSEPTGIVGGNKVDREKFSKMLDEYYDYLGWNRKGVPKKEFLKRKKPSYVPPTKPQVKQYRYYSDALGVARQGSSGSMNQDDSAARLSRRTNHQ